MATRSITLTRRSTGGYTATSASGASIDFGTGEGELSPVELLLAAVAGCSGVDIDIVTSRRAEPTTFEVVTAAEKVTDDNGGVRLDDLRVEFKVAFADDEAGRQADGMVERLIKLSHEKDCTVSRTIEHGASVEFVRVEA